MPIFDYHCQACGDDFELRVSAGTVPVCPHCHSPELDKLMSAPTAPGKSRALMAGARAQAAREGHFSHYKRSERPG